MKSLSVSVVFITLVAAMLALTARAESSENHPVATESGVARGEGAADAEENLGASTSANLVNALRCSLCPQLNFLYVLVAASVQLLGPLTQLRHLSSPFFPFFTALIQNPASLNTHY